MTGIHLDSIKDERVHRALRWLLSEIERHEYGEITINVKKNGGVITSIEKTITQKEYKK